MKKLLMVEDDPEKQKMLVGWIGRKFRDQFEIEWIKTYNDFQKAICSSEYVVYLLDQDLHEHPDPALASKTGRELKKEIQGVIPDAVIINIGAEEGILFNRILAGFKGLLTKR